MSSIADVRALPGNPFDDGHYDATKAVLKERVGKKRYKHSKGVAKTAKQLARVYGLDVGVARMAGLLHDWDKGLSHDELQRDARSFGLDLHPVIIDEMPWLLHGYTAAARLERDYPELGGDLFSAVARHTTGAMDMAPLDCAIYVADMIEPGRDYGEGDGLEELRGSVGKVPLEELYRRAFEFTLLYLVRGGRPLFPGTCEIYNDLVRRRTGAQR